MTALRFSQALTDALVAVVTFLPTLAVFLLIVLVGVLLARVIARAVGALLERVGLDRAAERGGIHQALSGSGFGASGIAGCIVYYALVLLVLQLAFGVFGPNPVSNLLTEVIAWLPQAFVAIVIIVVAAAVAKAVHDIVRTTLSGLTYGPAPATIAAATILGLGIIGALEQVGIATAVTTPVLVAVLATVSGVVIVGVGGGLVEPMGRRWGRWLDRAGQQAADVHQRVQVDAVRSPPVQADPAHVPAASATPAHAVPADPGTSTQPMTAPGEATTQRLQAQEEWTENDARNDPEDGPALFQR
jgi:hypothetical protein